MTTRHSLCVLLGTLALIFVLAACGEMASSTRLSGTGPGNGGPLDACALVTPADAAAALGDTVGPAKSEDRGGSCTYTGLTGQMPPAMSITLQNGSVADFALLKKMSGAMGGAVSTMAPGLDTALPAVIGDMGTLESVPGLGDDAFWNSGTSNVWVLTGNRQFSIQILKTSGAGGGFIPYKATTLALAQRAVARLRGAPVPAGAIVAPATPTMAADMKTVMAVMSAVPATPDGAALTAAAGMNAAMTAMPDAIATAQALSTVLAQAPTDAPSDTPAPPDATDTPVPPDATDTPAS